MHGNFFIILKSHFFICDSVDVGECKGNHPCHEMQTAPTQMDHIYVIVRLDILEMDKIAQVNSE